MIEGYQGGYTLISKSGVGQAIVHQSRILRLMNVETSGKYKSAESIVHINTVFPAAIIEAARAHRRGQKVVWFAHSTQEDFRNSFPGSNALAPLFGKWITFCYNHGDIIITPTEYSKRLLRGYGITKPIYALTNGVDTGVFRPDTRSRASLRDDFCLDESAKVVISVGLPIERKGILEFIETARKMPDVALLWYGELSKSLIKQNVRKAMADAPENLCFVGYVGQEELREAYQGADAFLFLSHEETEGIVVLEALACEVPVIVRDIDVYADWLKDGESAYKIKDGEDVATRLREVLDAPAESVNNVKARGREVAEGRDYTLSGPRLLHIYEVEGLRANG